MQTHDMALVDEIRRRLEATYAEALAALEESEGDLLRALAALEAKRKSGSQEAELVDRIFRVAEGGVKALRLRLGRKVIREVPVGMGAFGSLVAGLLADFLNEISLEVVKREE